MSSHSRLGETIVSTRSGISRQISRQLHQVTQPLSVLQGLLELSVIEARTVDDYKRSVERAIGELNRVTDCFNDLRSLLAQYQPACQSENTTAGEMVSSVASVLIPKFKSAGIELLPPAGSQDSEANSALIRTCAGAPAALSLAFLELLPLLAPGTRVEVALESSPTEVTVHLGLAGSGSRAPLSHDKLGALNFALAAIEPDGAVGQIRFCASPHRLSVRLPRLLPAQDEFCRHSSAVAHV